MTEGLSGAKLDVEGTVRTDESGESLRSGSIGERVERMEWLFRVVNLGVIIVLVLAIIGLVVDIIRESNLQIRISELEREVANYRIESLERIDNQQSQIINLSNSDDVRTIESNLENFKNCLKSGGWNRCFE